MEKLRGYKPEKRNWNQDFEKMCKELKYTPNRENLKKKASDLNGINEERPLYCSRGKGTL